MLRSTLLAVASGVVAVGVAAGAVAAVVERDSEPRTQVITIREAHRDSLDAMTDYRDYLDQKTSWSDNGKVGPCPSMIGGLRGNAVEVSASQSNTGKYTFLYFDGDENRSDKSDDTKLALYEGTPEDLASADNVVFFVPGTGTSWADGFSFSDPSLGQGGLNCFQKAEVKPTNWIGSAKSIRNAATDEAPDQRTVVVAWLGYDAPRASTDDKSDLARETLSGATPASSLFANEGGNALADHIGRFTRTGQHLSLVGHSYGSGPIGYALWKYGARGVDEVIGGGAPGLAVERSGDNCVGYGSTAGVDFPESAQYTRQCLPNVPENHFWALQAPDDWLLGGRSSVCWVVSGADRCSFFGDTLHGERFGAHEMLTNAKGYPNQTEHGDYFKTLNGERTLALVNTARVVVGRYGDVMLESAAPGVKYPGPRKDEPDPTAPPTWEEVSGAAIPSICGDQPPTTLVKGKSTAIPDRMNGAFELLETLENGQPGVLEGIPSNDAGMLTAVVASCDMGGVAWPNAIVFFSSGPEFYASTFLEDVDSDATQWPVPGLYEAAREGVNSVSLVGEQLEVFLYVTGPGDAACCSSYAALAYLSAHDKQVSVVKVVEDRGD